MIILDIRIFFTAWEDQIIRINSSNLNENGKVLKDFYALCRTQRRFFNPPQQLVRDVLFISIGRQQKFPMEKHTHNIISINIDFF